MTGRFLRLRSAGFHNATALLLAYAGYDVLAYWPVYDVQAVAS